MVRQTPRAPPHEDAEKRQCDDAARHNNGPDRLDVLLLELLLHYLDEVLRICFCFNVLGGDTVMFERFLQFSLEPHIISGDHMGVNITGVHSEDTGCDFKCFIYMAVLGIYLRQRFVDFDKVRRDFMSLFHDRYSIFQPLELDEHPRFC